MTPDPRPPDFARLARRSLVVLTLINLVNYLDRYVVAALAVSLGKPVSEGGLGLNDFQYGLLFPAFMVVMSMTAGLFGALGDRMPRPRLVAMGVAIWSLATGLGGLAGSFFALFLARSLVGVGEAAYGTISPALLADYFPPAQRGRVFSIFFAAIPVGAALGFILGGKVDQAFGWRAAFYVAGLPGLVLAALALRIHDPPRGGLDEPGDPTAASLAAAHGAPRRGSWREVYAPLVRLRGYRLVVLGYAFATFAAGGLALWMPAFLERVRERPKAEATVVLGMITATTALTGTYVGGVLADRLARRRANGHVLFCGLSTLLAAPFCALALLLPTPVLFYPAIVVGQLLLFASTGPVNLAIVDSVRPERRVAAVALSIFTIHMLGDVPSPPLIGLVSDHTSLRAAILVVPAFVALAGAVWTYAARTTPAHGGTPS